MIKVRLKGGMGNQMFQYAIGRALSIKYNTNLGLDLTYLLDRTPRPKFHSFTFRNYDLDVFNVKAEIISKSSVPFFYRKLNGKFGLYFDYFCRRFLKILGNEKKNNFDASVLNIGPECYLNGYWQSQKYFIDIEDVIRKDFSLKKPLSEKSQNLFEKINNEKSLGINVRRKEFVGNKVHGFVGKEYYDNAIKYIEKFKIIDRIYVFSDDIEWCKNNFKFSVETKFVGDEYKGEKAEEYLYLMSACKYLIISNSSFTWWAAWLNTYKDKIIIAPKKWYEDKNINSEDLIPKEWIKI